MKIVILGHLQSCAHQPEVSSRVLNVLLGMISLSLMIGACYVRTHYHLIKK